MRLHVVCLVLALAGTGRLERNEEAGLIHNQAKKHTAEDPEPIPFVGGQFHALEPHQKAQEPDSSSSAASASASENAARRGERGDFAALAQEAGLIHHLAKRQTAEDPEPNAYVGGQFHAPQPYQQAQEPDSSSSSSSSSSSAASASAAENAARRGEGGDPASRARANPRRGLGGNINRRPEEDSVASSSPDLRRRPSSSSSSSQAQNPGAQSPNNNAGQNQNQNPAGSSPSSSSSSDPSQRRRRPYYHYQAPISSGPRPASNGRQFLLTGYGQAQPQSQSQNPNQVPSQSHLAGVTRYTYRQPVDSSRASRRRNTNSRTYTFPFGGRAEGGGAGYANSQVSVRRTAQSGGRVPGAGVGSAGNLGGGAVGGAADAQRVGGGGDGTPGVDSRRTGVSQASVSGDDEPVVQVFPSERPVVNPTASQHQELLNQREVERQRRLQQLRRRQQQQQQQQFQSGLGIGAQRRPYSGQQQRPIYTGSTPLSGGYGQQVYYRGQGQGQGQPQLVRGLQPIYGGQGQPVYGGSQGQPVYGGSQGQPVYGGQGQPVYGNQGQPIYGGGGRVQQPYGGSYGYTQGGFDQLGYDECPNTGIRIQINGIPCEQAVDHYGSYLCYRHEYTSRECCLKCRGLKNPARVGCEYGDHSGRCQQLQPYDCYDLRNRQSCCQSCERMRIPGARSGCEYGDMTPNCEQVRQSPGLCYIPENRYLCCQTCGTIRHTDDPECPWGDQNADLCQPFDRTGNIRINCYAPPIKRICCQACRRLEEWIPINQPGCEYGDRPVTFNTGMHRDLNCTSFMRYYGYDQCNLNQAVATNCCYTCHRAAQG